MSPRAKSYDWQPIGSRIIIWESDWYQKVDPDLCLDVVSRSCQPLRYIRRWISRKPIETEAWFQRTTNRKWNMSYHGHVTDDVMWPQRCWRVEAVRSAILATAWLLVFSLLQWIIFIFLLESIYSGNDMQSECMSLVVLQVDDETHYDWNSSARRGAVSASTNRLWRRRSLTLARCFRKSTTLRYTTSRVGHMPGATTVTWPV